MCRCRPPVLGAERIIMLITTRPPLRTRERAGHTMGPMEIMERMRMRMRRRRRRRRRRKGVVKREVGSR